MPIDQLKREQIMIMETEEGRYGFTVDEVLGDHQTVIKRLGRFYRNIDLVSGAPILGNGTVALTLDPQRLVREALRAMSLHYRLLGAQPRSRISENANPNTRSASRLQAQLVDAPTSTRATRCRKVRLHRSRRRI